MCNTVLSVVFQRAVDLVSLMYPFTCLSVSKRVCKRERERERESERNSRVGDVHKQRC